MSGTGQINREPLCRMLGAVLVAVFLTACSDPAHDPSQWEGAPWGLRGANLPDDRSTIVRWFEAVKDPAIWTLPPFTNGGRMYPMQINLEASFSEGDGEITAGSVLPDRAGGHCAPSCAPVVQCDASCTAADILAAIAAEREPVVMSLNESAPVIFVVAAIDLQSQSGNRETISAMWFADPQGKWVFEIHAGRPGDVKLLARALAAAASP